jgi:hypothetical protein
MQDALDGTLGGEKICYYEEEQFTHGTILCIDGICMVCVDGMWEDKETVNKSIEPSA